MNSTGAAENPYFSIWWHPRATIRRIVDTNPRRMVLLLVSVAALLSAGGLFITHPPVAFTLADKPVHSISPGTWQRIRWYLLIGSVPYAIAGLYAMGALIRWSGSLIGGSAKAIEVRAALGWSRVVSIAGSLIWLAAISLGLYAAPQIGGGGHFSFRSVLPSLTPMGAVTSLFWIWWVVVYLECIAEVHRFSAWKAVAAWIIAWLAMIGVGVALGIVASIIAIPIMLYLQ
jgi:Yip1 domain